MTDAFFAHPSSHDVARAEIEAWRGECLDLFAQGEALIGALLELARDAGFNVKLHSLAPQRTLEAVRLVDMARGPANLGEADAALAAWQALESRSDLLARGIVTEMLDREGGWYALFDAVSYRGDRATRGRWAIGRFEAEDFRNELLACLATLKQQLGHVRRELRSQDL